MFKIKLQTIIPYVVFILVTCLLILLSFERFFALMERMYDLGNMTQGVWGIIHKGIPVNVNEGIVGTRFIGHFEPILYLVSVVYFFYQSPMTLLVIQSTVVGIGGLFIFYIAKKRLNLYWALGIQILYYSFPSVFGSNLLEFHPETLVLGIIPASFWYLRKKKYTLSLILAIAVMISKESLAPLAAFYGLYIYFFSKKKELGIFLFSLASVYFLVIFFVIIPHFSPTDVSIFFEGVSKPPFAWLGNSPKEIFQSLINPVKISEHIFNFDNLNYFLKLFGSFYFLPFLSVETFVALPVLLINFFSEKSPMKNIYFHYNSGIIPFMFFGFIGSLAAIFKRAHKIETKILVQILVGVLLFFSFIGFIDQDLRITSSYQNKLQKNHLTYLKKALTFISPDASVVTQNNLGPWVANREFVYLIPYHYKQADYVLLDLDDPTAQEEYFSCQFCAQTSTIKEYFEIIFDLLNDSNYGLIFYDNKILLFKRNAANGKDLVKRAKIEITEIMKNTFNEFDNEYLTEKLQ